MPERVELNPPWPWASQFRIAQGVRVGKYRIRIRTGRL